MTSGPPRDPTRDQSGYRRVPLEGVGPVIRSDIVDVYVFRRRAGAKVSGDVEFLQVLRAKPPLEQTWQPTMGHIEAEETAVTCALRELQEEIGLQPHESACLGLWALEQVHPYFVPQIDSIVLSARFAAEVAPEWEPKLDKSHSQHRWIARDRVERCFMWPGQLAAIREITESLLPEGSLSRERLRISP